MEIHALWSQKILAKRLAEYASRSGPVSRGGQRTRWEGASITGGLGWFNKGEREERIRQQWGKDQVRGEEVMTGRGKGIQILKGGRPIEYPNGLQRGQRGGLRVIRRTRQGKGGKSGTR